MQLILGECLEEMKKFEPSTIDTIITDPPYGLSFMGKKWDYDVPSIDIFKEMLRVAKPGATLLCFAGSRTQHRMACNIEDAGWILKDCIMWLYGSGFPKATDISKQLDKMGTNQLGWIEFSKAYRKIVENSSYNHNDIDKYLNIKASSCYWARTDNRGGLPPQQHWNKVKDLLGIGDEFDGLYAEAEREIIGQKKVMGKDNAKTYGKFKGGMQDITLSSTPEAKLWNGWKSHGLKPAYEPIIVAMKPNEGTYAENALKHGVSGLNIDGSRITSDKNAYKDDDSNDHKVLSHILSDIVRTLHSYKPFSLVELLEKDLLSSAVSYVQSWYKGKDSLCDCQTYHRLYDALFPLFQENDQDVFQKLHDVHDSISRLRKESSNTPHDYICHHSTCDVSSLIEKSYKLVNELYNKYTPKDIQSKGRFPANIILDKEAAELLDEQSGELKSGGGIKTPLNGKKSTFRISIHKELHPYTKDKGGASRFFYVAKASKSERNAGCDGLEEKQTKGGGGGIGDYLENVNSMSGKYGSEKAPANNHHPTVKPIKLMEYLCKLTKTPTGGIVLDPFMGSGTTGVACKITGRDFIGIEMEEEYIKIAEARINTSQQTKIC